MKSGSRGPPPASWWDFVPPYGFDPSRQMDCGLLGTLDAARRGTGVPVRYRLPTPCGVRGRSGILIGPPGLGRKRCALGARFVRPKQIIRSIEWEPRNREKAVASSAVRNGACGRRFGTARDDSSFHLMGRITGRPGRSPLPSYAPCCWCNSLPARSGAGWSMRRRCPALWVAPRCGMVSRPCHFRGCIGRSCHADVAVFHVAGPQVGRL
jgi:hypothetical protein